jgi:hypothetical protein
VSEIGIYAGIDWSVADAPQYEFHPRHGQVLHVPCNQINFRTDGTPLHCLGFFDYVADAFHRRPCPSQSLSSRGRQCTDCSFRDPFRLTHAASSIAAAPAELRGYLATSHYVYLATYGTGLFKIGTAQRDRIQTRLSEQGALAAILLQLETDAIAAHQTERRLSLLLGVPTTMGQSRKNASLLAPGSKDELTTSLGAIARRTPPLLNSSAVMETWFNCHISQSVKAPGSHALHQASCYETDQAFTDSVPVGQVCIRRDSGATELARLSSRRGAVAFRTQWRPVLQPSQLSLF